MPFTNYTNLDFDQIKTEIKNYLRANSNFTDFDFEGSNLSILIDILAYNTYISSFNSNLAVNEVFLDSATVRENVVSLAKNIGYVPRSKKAAKATVSFDISVNNSVSSVKLQPELVCVGSVDDSSYIFSISEEIERSAINGVASFSNIEIYQGRHLRQEFTVDGSLDQRFIIPNPNVDAGTIRVYVKNTGQNGVGEQYTLVDNLLNIDSLSKIYLIQEVKDEKYEIIFGDGIFGKKLENNAVITIDYIVTDGRDGNGASSFDFVGSLKDGNGNNITSIATPSVTTVISARNGSEIESIDSIRYYAPRIYSSQYRAVTARDYEALIKTEIYPNAEIVNVIGGEELDPPEFGSVKIAIKPKNGLYVSDFDKQQILSKLSQYTILGINQKITDIKVLYVELDSSIYYDSSKISTPEDLRTKVVSSLTTFSNSINSSKLGGRFRYSKAVQLIDESDKNITSNITKVLIRRNMNALTNQFAEYELCYGNKFYVNPDGRNIKSTGFKISSQLVPNTIDPSKFVYLTDIPNADKKTGNLAIIQPSSDPSKNALTIVKSAGVVDYEKGEIRLNLLNITSTELPNNVIEVQAVPNSNDIIALKDLFVSLDIQKSKINMLKDVIASGENTSGILFTDSYYRSSYSNGNLTRKVI